jgi:hypothetical protein
VNGCPLEHVASGDLRQAEIVIVFGVSAARLFPEVKRESPRPSTPLRRAFVHERQCPGVRVGTVTAATGTYVTLETTPSSATTSIGVVRSAPATDGRSSAHGSW